MINENTSHGDEEDDMSEDDENRTDSQMSPGQHQNNMILHQ
jgi:hypothetical protein